MAISISELKSEIIRLRLELESCKKALISAKNLFDCVETCSRNNFQQLAYEESESIGKLIKDINK